MEVVGREALLFEEIDRRGVSHFPGHLCHSQHAFESSIIGGQAFGFDPLLP